MNIADVYNYHSRYGTSPVALTEWAEHVYRVAVAESRLAREYESGREGVK
jgi:hypothetical protein